VKLLTSTSDVAETYNNPQSELPDLSRILPVVRWHDRFSLDAFLKREFLIIDRDRILAGKMSTRFTIDDAMFLPDPRPWLRANAGAISHPINLPFDLVTQIVVTRTSLTDRFKRKRTAVSLKISRSDSTSTHDVVLPLVECPFVLRALSELLGDRLDVRDDVRTAMDERARRGAEQSEKLHKANREKAGSAPPRRAVMGTFLVIAGLILLLGWPILFKLDSGIPMVIALFIGVPIGAELYGVGRRMRTPAYDTVIARDTRPPLVYLRSFGSEDVRIPDRPPGFAGQALLRLWDRAWFFSLPGTAIAWLVRLFYTVTGHAGDRLEEQLAGVLRRFGPMIAIGRPGESVAAGGAVRAYLSDDNWQDFVLGNIDRAQLVLLQIESTEGTWWEFGQCVRRIPPERLLLMLTAKFGSQQRYDEMRVLAERTLGLVLPRNMGDAAFLYFDPDGTVHRAPMVWHHFLLSWLMPSPINIRRSLAPVTARLAAG
jgi:hypothetical protein